LTSRFGSDENSKQNMFPVDNLTIVTTTPSSLMNCIGCLASQVKTVSPDGSLTVANPINLPSGCQQLLITCPKTQQFTVVYANGAIVQDTYVGPIVLMCNNTNTRIGVSSVDKFVRQRFQQSNAFWIDPITDYKVVACYCSASK
jgi:hypothetical protein